MATVFHDGELVIQTESGVEERMHKLGNKLIRDHIIDQHKAFFENLSYVFVALHDESGQPWVSLIQGEPGFIYSPDIKTLNLNGSVIGAQQVGLQTDFGCPISIVGLDLSNRRRNRLNGTLTTTAEDQPLSIAVEHSFGNCPKYIQLRQYEPSITDGDSTALPTIVVEKLHAFSLHDIKLIKKTDTLFIASTDKTGGDLDVNHRGGKPGFVRVESSNQLWFNDYPGNNFFQTFGNIHNHPNVGLMFLDFESGDLLLVSGMARLEKLNSANRETTEKTTSRKQSFLPRRFHFTLERGFRFKNAVDGRWSASELSPFLSEDLD